MFVITFCWLIFRQAVFAETVAHIQQEFPNYELQAAMDTDFSEE